MLVISTGGAMARSGTPFRYLGAAARTEVVGAWRVLRGAAAGAYFDKGDDRRVFSPSALSWAWWRGHAQTTQLSVGWGCFVDA